MRQTVAQATEAAAELANRQLEAGTLKPLDVANQQGFHAQAKLDVARKIRNLLPDYMAMGERGMTKMAE